MVSVTLLTPVAERRPLVLASASPARARLLQQAGVPMVQDPAAVDEDELKRSMQAEGASAAAVAVSLAELKAVRVSRRHPEGLVIGADQMLECNGVWFDKPVSRRQGLRQLLALRGRTHELVCAACAVRGGARLWHHVATARLTMRPFSDAFANAYLDAAGSDALSSARTCFLGSRVISSPSSACRCCRC
jgi:septum formation protein